MKIDNEIKLDFTDVLFKPNTSHLSSRSEVSLERTFSFKYSKQTWRGVPIISSNMDTISSIDMFKVLSKHKCLTCFHKYININEVVEACKDGYDSNFFILSTGILDKDYHQLKEKIDILNTHNIGLKFICIDVANGYMLKLVDFCKKVRKDYPNITLIAGNVVTSEMVEKLVLSGTMDIIKVGIGSGAVCTTRLKAGVGLPQFSAVVECSAEAHRHNALIISDGGICHPGDASKAIGGGADFVMIGSMLAGHDECPGELIENELGEKYKMFYGMSSETAMKKHNGGVSNYRSSEGKTVKVPYKGGVVNTIQDILGGIRSTCTYIGASNIEDMNKCASFIRVNNQVNNFYK